jgi:hypothetical protein
MNFDKIKYNEYEITFDTTTNFNYIINFINTQSLQRFSCPIKYHYETHFPFLDEDINFVHDLIINCAKTNDIKIIYDGYDSLTIQFIFEINNKKKIITKMFIDNTYESRFEDI